MLKNTQSDVLAEAEAQDEGGAGDGHSPRPDTRLSSVTVGGLQSGGLRALPLFTDSWLLEALTPAVHAG